MKTLALAFTALPALCFAQQPGTAPAVADELIYRIRPGDTLIGLGQRLLRPEADWRAVESLNGVARPRRLQPGGSLRIPLALLREEPVAAEVLHVHGGVWLERDGRPRQPLAPAAMLQSGDRIVVDAQSSASLRYADGSRSVIGPETSLRLDRLARIGPAGIGVARTSIRLEAGQVDTRVVPARPAPRFELKTPVANLGVRGTEFRARAGGEAALAEVLEGRVAMGEAALAGGFGTRATPAGVAPPRRLLPAPDLDGLPERIERLPLAFTLARRPAGPRFRAQVLEGGPGGQLLLDGLFDDVRIVFDASPPDGRYELRVRSSDVEGVEGFDAHRPFVLKARPEPPELQRPRSGERLESAAVTLAWAPPQTGTAPLRYRVQVADNPAFAPLREQRDGVNGTELALTLPPGRWFWRVASVRAEGDVGPLSDARGFERADRTVEPTAAWQGDGRVRVAWPAAATPGSRYQLQMARDPGFADLLLDLTLDGTELALPDPEPGSYHLRIRALPPEGPSGGFGNPRRLDVPPAREWPWLLLVPPLLMLAL